MPSHAKREEQLCMEGGTAVRGGRNSCAAVPNPLGLLLVPGIILGVVFLTALPFEAGFPLIGSRGLGLGLGLGGGGFGGNGPSSLAEGGGSAGPYTASMYA
eukprot:249176-Chlamydomonas_euryale.AAC.2